MLSFNQGQNLNDDAKAVESVAMGLVAVKSGGVGGVIRVGGVLRVGKVFLEV